MMLQFHVWKSNSRHVHVLLQLGLPLPPLDLLCLFLRQPESSCLVTGHRKLLGGAILLQADNVICRSFC